MLGRVFCSKKCSDKHKYIARQIYQKNCAICGTEFKTSNKHRLHCSKSCSNKSTNRKKADEAAMRHEAYLKREQLRETMERRVKHSKMMPLETAHADAIKAFLKRERLRETMERRVKHSKMMPLETSNADASKAFLQRGGTIKQYQPQDAELANTAVPENFWSYDQYDAEI